MYLNGRTKVNRVDWLQKRHSEIHQLIENLESTYNPDESLIADLKKRKLKIKDEIARMQNEA